MPRKLSLVGQKFTKLTVLREHPVRIRRNVAWECECECGNTCVAIGQNLVRRIQISCGCMQRRGAPRKNGTALSNQRKIAPSTYFNSAKKGAEKRGISWSLTREQWSGIVNRPCAMCGDRTTVGVDRFDNTQGYTESNTLSMCWECNRAKGPFTIGEFRTWIDRVVRHSGLTP